MLQIMYALPADKVLHMFTGLMIFGIFYFLLRTPMWLNLIIVATAAFGKEVYDSMGYGTTDIVDFIATIAPAFFMTILNLLNSYISKYKEFLCLKGTVMSSIVKVFQIGVK